MKEKQVQQILEELKQTFPMYDISPLPTQQRGNRQLIVVKGFKNEGSLDAWAVGVIYPLRWKMLLILEKYEGATRDLRLLFIRENQFVLYSPDIGYGNVFKEMKKPLRVGVYGDFEHQRYIGECETIDDVIEYLTTNTNWF